jgi:7-keto-8-aminopelargonate synthetase-like enzyme
LKVRAQGRFAKCYEFNVADQLRKVKLYPYFTPFEVNEGPVARLDGREVIMLGSNNYLGLTTHPKVREAVVDAVHKYGPSMTGSRLLNGTTKFHEAFEVEFAEFMGAPACLVFATGYQANLGVVSAGWAGCHTVITRRIASIHDGARMAEGELRVFPHASWTSSIAS